MKVINALFLLAPSLSALAISCCESFLITVNVYAHMMSSEKTATLNLGSAIANHRETVTSKDDETTG